MARRLTPTRLLLLLVLSGMLLMAVAMFFLPWDEFLPAALIQVGAALGLVGPILYLERRLGERVETVRTEVEDARADLAQAEARLDDLTNAERISADVAQRLIDARAEDEQLFEDISERPTADGIRRAVLRAVEVKAISRRGPRVRLFDTGHLVRFNADANSLRLDLEEECGDVWWSLPWADDQTAVDVCEVIGKHLQATNRYPGDVAFQPGRMFDELRELVELVYSYITGATGVTIPYAPAIQKCRQQWLITDRGVEAIDDLIPYVIEKERFGDLDWDRHVTAKGWVDRVSFRMAFETAICLQEAGRL